MVKAGRPAEEQLARVKIISEASNTAKSEPSETCFDGKEHRFRHVMHGDGPKSYFNLYECENCHEFVKREHQRTGINAEYWTDDDSGETASKS